MEKKKWIEKAINWASRRSGGALKAKHDDYESPKVFTNTSTEEEVQADISFVTRSGAKNYTDIALKSDRPQKLITRWKLLSMMASLNRGKLYLMAPRGHKMFAKRLVDKYKIRAEVVSL